MRLRCLTFVFVFMGVSVAHGRGPSSYQAGHKANYQAYARATAISPKRASSALGVPIPGRVLFEDRRRGVPTFIWANPKKFIQSPHHSAPEAARFYLAQFSHVYGLTKAALDTVYVRRVHDTGRGGIIVFLGQRIGRIEVMRNQLQVLMKRDFGLVALSGNLHNAAVNGQFTFALSDKHALARALGDYAGTVVDAGKIRGTGRQKNDYRYWQFGNAGLALAAPARTKRVLYPLPDRLVPGYLVEILPRVPGRADSDGYEYVIAADDGRVLMRKNLLASDAFHYTVWADETAPFTPLDGPQADFTPHPTGVPDGSYPVFIAPATITMEGFNENPEGGVDPWLAQAATETRGNNVDAYADLSPEDGYTEGSSDLRPEITSANTFDRVYDPLFDPFISTDQIAASITQLFYVTNWLHDYFYNAGFNEAAGNAQENNLGRGGDDHDVLRAEAQDYSGLNNANMLTPRDGASPRMQMYLWEGRYETGMDALAQSFATGRAVFGSLSFDVTADLILVDDGVAEGSITDGCEPFVNHVSGLVAVVDRGACAFVIKAQNALDAGAVAMLLVNNTPGEPPPVMGRSGPGNPDIPALSVTYEDGESLKAAMAQGTVSARLWRTREQFRDGTIDNAIVAHEWGHYIHHRLTECTTQQCGGQSEGWGDFIALLMMMREGDDPDGAYAVASYSTWRYGDNSAYFGIRRVPYSASTDINALSLRHISDGEELPTNHPILTTSSPNSEVHNAGEIWSALLFQGFAALIEESRQSSPRYGFAEAKRRMADYVVAGLQLAPVDPTYTEQLRAILAAAYAADTDDYMLLANAFASRGAGSCAQSPPRHSLDLTGVVEDHEVRGEIALVSITLSDELFSCDLDGNPDAGERGRVRVVFENTGDQALTGTEVMVTSKNPHVAFPEGSSVTIATTPQFGRQEASFAMVVSDDAPSIDTMELTVIVSNPDACETTVQQVQNRDINLDIGPASVDTVEPPTSAWTPIGLYPDNWSRTEIPADNFVWHGADSGFVSDTVLVSPALDVSRFDDFVIQFEHRYSFEADITYWDGGVIEISNNGGVTWRDIATLVDPGYNGVINNSAENPLSDRMAYSGTNPSFPDMDMVTLNLGTVFARQTLLMRFRIGTDQSVGDYGWDIDNISVQGVSNLPFYGLVEDKAECTGVPVADAGPDQTVTSGESVTLDALNSTDPDGDELTFYWEQVAGPVVSLTARASATPQFVAPEVDTDTVLEFEVMVGDGKSGARDAVEIQVREPITEPDAGPGQPDAGDVDVSSGGCCQTGQDTPAGTAGLILLVMLAVLRITRRSTRPRGRSVLC